MMTLIGITKGIVMDFDLNFEPLTKIRIEEATESDEEGDELSENDEAHPASNPMSPLAMSSIISSSQIVTKGAKGQLIKNRPNDKPPKSADYYLGLFTGKVGDKAATILKDYSEYNKNKKDQPLADMLLRNTVRDYQITKRTAFSVFGIGNPRWKRVMNSQLVVAKEDIDYCNPNAVTEDDLKAFKLFITSIKKIPGYPCNHRRQKL